MSITYVCGIDRGSQSCAGCVLRLDKSVVVKPLPFAQCQAGVADPGGETEPVGCGTQPYPHWDGSHVSLWGESVSGIGTMGICAPSVVPRTNPSFSPATGVGAKTDRLDAMTIARVLLSGEARTDYMPSERVATYRELVRLPMQLSDEAAA